MKLLATPLRRDTHGGASGKCKYDYTVGFDSTAGVRYRPPRPCLPAGRRGISRLAREPLESHRSFQVSGSFSNGHVRTGENRHEKQRENKPFEGNAEKEEYKKEPKKIER